jgi:hypothetical protein
MKKMTLSQRMIRFLVDSRGMKIVPGKSSRRTQLAIPERVGHFYFVGRSGAVRSGACSSKSISVTNSIMRRMQLWEASQSNNTNDPTKEQIVKTANKTTAPVDPDGKKPDLDKIVKSGLKKVAKLKLTLPPPVPKVPDTPKPPVLNIVKPESPLSQLDAAAKVLNAAAKPMNTKEILQVMVTERLWTSPAGKTPAATLYSALLREINQKGEASRFKKTGPGHFSLKG